MNDHTFSLEEPRQKIKELGKSSVKINTSKGRIREPSNDSTLQKTKTTQ